MGIRYNPALDGLRAIAVLSVVAFHAGLPVPAGFVGVDVFFVISGYLITRLLHDEVQATGRIDFMAFYARRARRILPALVLVILATLGIAAHLGVVADVGRSAAAAGAFLANVFFQRETDGYWGADAHGLPLLHLWSLSVEEQFYLVWPVVLILARRKPVAALTTLALASFALAEWLLWSNPEAAFYQMPSRAWELALGGLVALRPIAVPKWGAWVGLAVVLTACFAPIAHFPGAGALPAVAGSALLIAAIQQGQNPRLLTLKPVVYVGLISYSLYLWHWPLLAFYHAQGGQSLAVKVLLCLLAVVLAGLTYRFVENPARRSKRPNRETVLAGLVPVIVAVSLLPVLQPTRPDTTSATSVYARGCDSWIKSAEVHPCTFGKATNGRTVVVMGDSVALQWFPALHTIFADWRIVVLTKSSCAMVDEPFYYARIKSEFTVCAQWRRDALNYANGLRPDLVVMGSSVDYRFTPEQWTRGTAKVLQSLPDAKRIRILRGTPFLVPWNDGQAATDSIKRGAAMYANVAVVDMTDAVCRQGCSRANYRDVVHLKSAFVTSLTADLRERLCVTCGGTAKSEL